MRNPRVTFAVIAVAAAVTVGGVTLAAASGSTTKHQPPGSGTVIRSATPTRDLPSFSTVRTATATVQGRSESILVDAKGLPLYIFKPDTPTISRVTGQLAALWPPLIGGRSAVSGTDGVLTTVPTTNGNQVAYNGHFLYTFVEDRPGRVTGQGVQNFFVATPGLAAGASTTAKAAPVAPNNSYGY
jgi:predicted lipoprotein with Yx(FWY)xxD motif